MRSIAILLFASVILACEQQTVSAINISADEFSGAWYGTYANGRETTLFDAMLHDDGRLEISHYTCLSSNQLSMHQQKGTWQVDRDIMMMTLNAADNSGDETSAFVASYLVTYHSPDFTRYKSMESGSTFWKERKWTDQEYNCATTAAEIREHRQTALDDGRADASNPLNEAKP